ncbi:MAG TPA: ABC transporter permease [Thermomicrobiales bacterium]|nr:ABC transporter permease [Thermomicrobiales bacterium]
MIRYLLRRIAGILGVLVFISLLTFALMHAIPGGPFDEDKMPLTPEQKANILRSFGLDRPLWQQYLIYAWNALHLDFGVSYQSPGETVIQLIARVWPVSLQLGAMALALAFAGGLTLGSLAAVRQNTWVDYLVTLLSTFGLIVPNFILGVLLILLFSDKFHLLPTGGWSGPRNWAMPVLAYALGPLGVVARYTRTSVIEALRADYVRTAYAKGLRGRVILRRHVLRNALIPLLTIMGPLVPDLLTGSLFVEVIFRVPGLGRFFVTSTLQRDYPMIMGLALLAAGAVSLTYLVTDLLYVAVDPRIRHA